MWKIINTDSQWFSLRGVAEAGVKYCRCYNNTDRRRHRRHRQKFTHQVVACRPTRSISCYNIVRTVNCCRSCYLGSYVLYYGSVLKNSLLFLQFRHNLFFTMIVLLLLLIFCNRSSFSPTSKLQVVYPPLCSLRLSLFVPWSWRTGSVLFPTLCVVDLLVLPSHT